MSFFFQAEDGIRDRNVTGVQTCALPIFRAAASLVGGTLRHGQAVVVQPAKIPARIRAIQNHNREVEEIGPGARKIGRASCRERVEGSVDEKPRTKKSTRLTACEEHGTAT